MSDLELDRSYRLGDTGQKVTLIQEWLCLNGEAVLVDGTFGPATDCAIRRFQKYRHIRRDGVVGPITFAALIRPMTIALRPLAAKGAEKHPLGGLVCLYAYRHWKSQPREVGGQNKGPWVRLYMDGRQGPEWPWCAGFVCFLLRQACKTLGADLPLTPSVSCDALAAGARERGLFLAGAPGLDPGRITPGCLFLNRGAGDGWNHTGIVLGCRTTRGAVVLETMEGNTNDDGSREGYDVCHRWRDALNKDFIVV